MDAKVESCIKSCRREVFQKKRKMKRLTEIIPWRLCYSFVLRASFQLHFPWHIDDKGPTGNLCSNIKCLITPSRQHAFLKSRRDFGTRLCAAIACIRHFLDQKENQHQTTTAPSMAYGFE